SVGTSAVLPLPTVGDHPSSNSGKRNLSTILSQADSMKPKPEIMLLKSNALRQPYQQLMAEAPSFTQLDGSEPTTLNCGSTTFCAVNVVANSADMKVNRVVSEFQSKAELHLTTKTGAGDLSERAGADAAIRGVKGRRIGGVVQLPPELQVL